MSGTTYEQYCHSLKTACLPVIVSFLPEFSVLLILTIDMKTALLVICAIGK